MTTTTNTYEVTITYENGDVVVYHVRGDSPPTFPDSGWWNHSTGVSTSGKDGPFSSLRVRMSDNIRSIKSELA